MRRVTYSRNYTVSLSRSCDSVCKYCAFATRGYHLHEPAEVERQLDDAVKRRAKELLVLTGENPEARPGVAERLRKLGHRDFVSYVAWTCEQALERGLLPHTNIGAVDADALGRLRSVTASQGLMLESISERLMDTVHAGSPSKHPERRMATIEAAGRLRIPFTSGILVGIGETEEERIASLEALAASHERHGHLQELIIQNAVPHPRYHGRDVGELADRESRRRWSDSAERADRPEATVDDAPAVDPAALPAWASPVSLGDLRRLVAEARRLMGPEVGIQVPPNLSDWWVELIEAGASDLGGLSANGDHISPEQPFPSPAQMRERLRRHGIAIGERLCAYPGYLDAEWQDPAVLDLVRTRYWSFIPRGSSGRPRARTADASLTPDAVAKGRDGQELTLAEMEALFAETRPEAIEDMRQAADELRAELAGEVVTYVVNRNINFTNVCTVGCAFCGFGQGRRSPDAYELDEQDFVTRLHGAVEAGATEVCLQGGIHPDYTLDDYGRWLELVAETTPSLHAHAYSPMELHAMCELSGRQPADVVAYLRDRGLGSTPGTAAEVLDDGVRERISPNKLPAARWLEIVEAVHRAGVPSTSTVMFGHIEEPHELAVHMQAIRRLQERTGGITEFVPLSFIPFQTLLGRTHGIEEISREENLKHTAAFRLCLGRSIRNLQASWVKMGLDAATESLRWGVNDLGGTLMEESISRMAGSQHGTRLEPHQLRAAAHAAGRPVAERSTLYELREAPELAPRAAAGSPA
ncbi:MAG: 5-amino-6-(D-ribitylamino)uracil--L-tyrosine 4-hydroxyphenyl transferase CofH [Solirubrobacterales bacterium]